MHALISLEATGSSLVDPAAAAALASYASYGLSPRGTKQPSTFPALCRDIACFIAWRTAAGCLALAASPEDVAAMARRHPQRGRTVPGAAERFGL